MKATTARESVQTLELPPRHADAAQAWQLLVLREGTSSAFPLPRSGTVTIGRAPEAQLVIDDPSISRHHARLTVTAGQVAIVDLGSRNGTLVNGRTVSEPRELVFGDVLQIGTVTLVLSGAASPQVARSTLSLETLRRRLGEELSRAAHDERPTSAIALLLDDRPEKPAHVVETLSPFLRAHDLLAWSDPAQLLVVLPEVDGEDARAVAAQLVSAFAVSERGDGRGGLADTIDLRCPSRAARAGVASSPADAIDADSLLHAARAAATAAASGQVQPAGLCVRRVQLGAHVMVMADPAMVALDALLQRLARTELPVLIVGETGSGKELAAQTVHHHSARRGGPFVAINCAALPDTLVETELFGHERGAFTGATRRREGLLEAARGGTVFLDELGELSRTAQAKLLRAVETRRIVRVGDVKERPIDVRIVAATHRDLEAAVREGTFREDLLFRLRGATVSLPPLRHRRGEIPVLARAFLDEARARTGLPPLSFSLAALQALVDHDWPGNVRELKNVASVLAATLEGALVEPWHLPASVLGPEAPAPLPVAPPDPGPLAPVPPKFRRLSDEVRELEQRRIREALHAAGGVQKHAAALIGMPLRTFVMKVKRYGLQRSEQR